MSERDRRTWILLEKDVPYGLSALPTTPHADRYCCPYCGADHWSALGVPPRLRKCWKCHQRVRVEEETT